MRLPLTSRSAPLFKPAHWPSYLPPETRLQKHVLRPHRTRIIAIITGLHTIGLRDHVRWADRLAACCRTGFLHHDPDTGRTRPWYLRCRSRLCPFCAKGRARDAGDAIHALVETMTNPKHLTLTYRSRPDPLSQQIHDMLRAFKSLRRHPEWRRRVRGGVYTVEVTRNPQTNLWHPHLHVLMDSTYFPQPLLAKLWSQAMEGGENVWIREVTNAANAAWEISKYVGKAPEAEKWPAIATIEFAEALHGSRMLQTFGNAHGRKLPQLEEPPAEKPESNYVSLPAMAYLAAQGLPVAMDLAALCWSRFPALRSYLEDVCPAAIAADTLQTNPVLICPRPPELRPGSYGPITDQADQVALETALDLTTLLWIGMVTAGELDETATPPHKEN